MQAILPFDAPPTDAPARPRMLAPASDPAAVSDVQLVRHPRARRYVIRVRADGTVRVTIPRHGSKREALHFAREKADWIARQRQRVQSRERAPRSWTSGRPIWVGGRLVPLQVTQIPSGRAVAVADELVPIGPDEECLRSPVQACLRRRAVRDLPTRVHALAAAHALRVSRVTVRDQRTRWGSCSSSGRISLNWRLVQMPVAVADYVIIHELMHLRQPNHSRRFWALVEAACPTFRDARAWLRRHGGELL